MMLNNFLILSVTHVTLVRYFGENVKVTQEFIELIV